MIVQFLVTIFVAFAASRVYLRFRARDMSMSEFLFWLIIWSGIEAVVWIPKALDRLASYIGIERGIDVMVYGSVILLYYLVYRLYVKAELIEHDVTSLVRKLTLKDQ